MRLRDTGYERPPGIRYVIVAPAINVCTRTNQPANLVPGSNERAVDEAFGVRQFYLDDRAQWAPLSGQPRQRAAAGTPSPITPCGLKRRCSISGKDGVIFRVQDNRGIHRINGRLGRWTGGGTNLSVIPLKTGPTPVSGETKTTVAASGTWTDASTFMMTVRFIETAHYGTIACPFDKERLPV